MCGDSFVGVSVLNMERWIHKGRRPVKIQCAINSNVLIPRSSSWPGETCSAGQHVNVLFQQSPMSSSFRVSGHVAPGLRVASLRRPHRV